MTVKFFYEVPESWQVSQKLFKEAATGGVL